MRSKSSDKEEIINQIKLLTSEKGFIYSLCMIISEDLLFLPLFRIGCMY